MRLVDVNINWNVEDPDSKALSHAQLLRNYLFTGQVWPDAGKRKKLGLLPPPAKRKAAAAGKAAKIPKAAAAEEGEGVGAADAAAEVCKGGSSAAASAM